MKKSEFVSILRQRLSGLSQEDVTLFCDYYAEMIDDRVEEGMDEEDAVAALGSMDAIVAQILSEMPLPKLVKSRIKPRRTLRAWEIVLLALGSVVWIPLLAAALICLLALYIVIWAVAVVFYAADLTLAAGAITGVFGCVLFFVQGSIGAGIAIFGMGLILAGLAVLAFFGCNQVARGILFISKRILLGIKSCFIRKETQNESF